MEWLRRNHLSEVVVTDTKDLSTGGLATTMNTYSRPFSSGGSDQFAGQKEDPESGLKDFGARHYGSTLARWTSADSILGRTYDPLSLNKYAYVRNDPVNAVDPDGRKATWISDNIVIVEPDPEPGAGGGSDPNAAEEVHDSLIGVIPEGSSGGAGSGNPGDIAVGIANEWKDAISAKTGWNSDCETLLGEFGLTGSAISAGAKAANILNGVGSSVSVASLYLNSGLAAAAVAQYGNTTIDTYLVQYPDTKAMAQLNGHDIYINPKWWIGYSPKENFSTVVHELIHNLSGYTDPDFKRILKDRDLTDEIRKNCW